MLMNENNDMKDIRHVNFKTSRHTKQTNLNVQNLKNDGKEWYFFEECIYIKQYRTCFLKGQFAEVFHADLCCKMNQSYYYYDFRLYEIHYIYFLKEKTEILNYLKQFYANVQANRYNIKRLRVNYDKRKRIWK